MTSDELKTADRITLTAYLEARGFAVYANESTAKLRRAAVEDALMCEREVCQ